MDVNDHMKKQDDPNEPRNEIERPEIPETRKYLSLRQMREQNSGLKLERCSL